MRNAARGTHLLLRAAMPRIFLATALLLTIATRARAVEIGVSGPSVYGGDVDAAITGAKAVEATGTTWARLNFRLDVWSGPEDATRRRRWRPARRAR